jgi:hypothetical protein
VVKVAVTTVFDYCQTQLRLIRVEVLRIVFRIQRFALSESCYYFYQVGRIVTILPT